jgi:hypothetical protein
MYYRISCGEMPDHITSANYVVFPPIMPFYVEELPVLNGKDFIIFKNCKRAITEDRYIWSKDGETRFQENPGHWNNYKRITLRYIENIDCLVIPKQFIKFVQSEDNADNISVLTSTGKSYDKEYTIKVFTELEKTANLEKMRYEEKLANICNQMENLKKPNFFDKLFHSEYYRYYKIQITMLRKEKTEL